MSVVVLCLYLYKLYTLVIVMQLPVSQHTRFNLQRADHKAPVDHSLPGIGDFAHTQTHSKQTLVYHESMFGRFLFYVHLYSFSFLSAANGATALTSFYEVLWSELTWK